MSMNQAVKDYLEKKLVDTCVHVKTQKQEKTDLVGGYNREIKQSEKRVSAYSAALQKEEWSHLDILEETELEHLHDLQRGKC